MGWQRFNVCTGRERKGGRERDGGGGNKRKVSRDWRSQKYWRIKSNFHLWSVYYTLSGRAIIIKYTNILTYCIFYVSAEKTNEKAAKDDDDWSRHTSGTVVCLSDVLSVIDKKRPGVIQTGIPISMFRPRGDLFNIDQECHSAKVRSNST